MADIKNYTLNFVYGRRASARLNLLCKLACNEVQGELSFGEGPGRG